MSVPAAIVEVVGLLVLGVLVGKLIRLLELWITHRTQRPSPISLVPTVRRAADPTFSYTWETKTDPATSKEVNDDVPAGDNRTAQRERGQQT